MLVRMLVMVTSLYGTASAVFFKRNEKPQTPLNPSQKFDFGKGEVGCKCIFGKYDKLCQCCHSRHKCQDRGEGACEWTSKLPVSLFSSRSCTEKSPPMVYDVEVADPTTHGCKCLFKSDDSPNRRQCKCCFERNACMEKKACAWDKAAFKFSFKACTSRTIIETAVADDGLKQVRGHAHVGSLLTAFTMLLML